MNTTKASPQGTNRKTAAVVGVLFILGTVPALLSLPLAQNTVNAPDHLIAISTNAGQMILFTAVKFIMLRLHGQDDKRRTNYLSHRQKL